MEKAAKALCCETEVTSVVFAPSAVGGLLPMQVLKGVQGGRPVQMQGQASVARVRRWSLFLVFDYISVSIIFHNSYSTYENFACLFTSQFLIVPYSVDDDSPVVSLKACTRKLAACVLAVSSQIIFRRSRIY